MNTESGSRERSEFVESVASRSYDLTVVGGGIAGAGVARDAAMRGLDVLLVERNDFASGTTAGSTRLLHGGLRYLEQFEFSLVFESLRERETVAELAPHLVEPLTFVIPQYGESLASRVKVRLGMVLYDVLSFGKSMPWHGQLSSAEVAAREPGLRAEGLQGGFVYHDRKAEFVERLCVENVLDAAGHGADVLNHAAVMDVRAEAGRATGVTVRDVLGEETFEVESAAVVNAAGPWVDEVLDGDAGLDLVRPTKGVHLVVRRLTEHALTLPTTDDRVIFVVPWNGQSLVGTTDTDFEGDPGVARADAADVEYLLAEAGRYFPELGEEDVLYTYAGVRPLYDPGTDADASAVSREHQVVDHGDVCEGLFSLVGAKITPYRSAAEDATDAVADYLGVDARCRTDTTPLPGGRDEPVRESDLPPEVVAHVEDLYGARADDVFARIERDERLAEPLCEHTNDVLAQVTVAVEEEYARTLPDVMLRRCTVGYEECEGLDAVETVAAHVAGLLDWDSARMREEIADYEAIIERRHAYADER